MDKNNEGYVIVDGMKTPINGHTNLLEVIRSSGVDLPTFCYHSELSIYGACRMCIAEIEGRGIQPTCSTPPEDGMVVKTHTDAAMRIRRMALELMLANHHGNCQTCEKNTNCRLQELAERLGVKQIRFEESHEDILPIDDFNQSIVRDPNKCILCGDCVRMCKEVQGIGVLDFTGRGSDARVTPAFGKNLDQVECVYCGQCVSVCPTGALTVKSEVDKVWAAINNPKKHVVVQVAPAVRAAIAQEYNISNAEQALGKTVSAMRRMGFDKVFDTSFAADLTTVEEATEFLGRMEKGERLPLFTSCCPAWVKFAEQFYPDYIDNLSTCRSPQQMFGSLAKKHYSEELGVPREDIFVVSIMPCTAKKYEAMRPEFVVNNDPDINVVLTSQELIKMIGQAGLKVANLPLESMDLPFGFKTGAGIIFGNSGGVAEAVLRLASSKAGDGGQVVEFHQVRGLQGIKEATVNVNGTDVRLAVVSGLANAKETLEKMKKGEVHYDILEIMACRGGCIGGGGQPLPNDIESRQERIRMIYDCDAIQTLHNAADNPFIKETYEKVLQEPNSPVAHELLHTGYTPRRRITGEAVELSSDVEEVQKTPVSVCVGTNCYLRGSYDTLKRLAGLAKEAGVADQLDFKATFCFENCMQSPNVQVDGELHGGITPDKAEEFFTKTIKPLVEGKPKKAEVEA